MRSSQVACTHEQLHNSRGYLRYRGLVGDSERARTPICVSLHSFSSSVADRPLAEDPIQVLLSRANDLAFRA